MFEFSHHRTHIVAQCPTVLKLQKENTFTTTFLNNNGKLTPKPRNDNFRICRSGARFLPPCAIFELAAVAVAVAVVAHYNILFGHVK